MAATRQETFCTVSQPSSSTIGRTSRLGTELTFSSCSRAMHTCLVRLSNLFNTINTETPCQVPWFLHIHYETMVLRSNWPSSSLSILYLPQRLRSSKYMPKSLPMQITLLTLVYRQHTTTSYPSTVSQTSLRKTFTS